MCTVTVIPHDGAIRVMCNRDEQRSRPAAVPPRLYALGSRVAAFPVDPRGGGTWIGLNDAGLIVALLNRHATADDANTLPRRSRGLIVRDLLGYGCLRQALHAAARVDRARFEPFSLVVVQGSTVAVVTSDGQVVRCTRKFLERPLLFTSSSLGDAMVDAPRRRLFERLVVRGPAGWLDGQARFHRHQWRRRPEISIHMERSEAMTVSRTVVDVAGRRGVMTYEALGDSRPAREGRPAWCSLD